MLNEKIELTNESLYLATKIKAKVKTFHIKHRVIFDIARAFGEQPITYVEIGCYAGASACLMMHRKNTRIFSVDIGAPVKKETAEKNIADHNIHNNLYNYIEGDSTSLKTITTLREMVPEGIDILFIDGSHKFNHVLLDFLNYSKMVKKGGYIVFDDFDDYEFSPEVKPAVNYLYDWFMEGFEILDRVPNEFIIRKK